MLKTYVRPWPKHKVFLTCCRKCPSPCSSPYITYGKGSQRLKHLVQTQPSNLCMKKSPSQETTFEEALSEVSPQNLGIGRPPLHPRRALPDDGPGGSCEAYSSAPPCRGKPFCATAARTTSLSPRSSSPRGPRTQRGLPGRGGSARPGAAESAGPETGNAAEPISEFSVCCRCKNKLQEIERRPLQNSSH